MKSKKAVNISKILDSISVSTSGFNPVDTDGLKNVIEKLGGTFHVHMKKSTKVLISNKVNSEKCKAAKGANIPIVEIEWLNQCNRQKKYLDPDDYPLKCFTGIEVKFFGFNKSEEEELGRKVKENGGLWNKDGGFQECEMIIMKSGFIFTNQELVRLESYQNKMYTMQWLEDCIERQEYLDASKYKFSNDMLRVKFEILEKEFLRMENEILEEEEKNLEEETDDPKKGLLLFHNLIFHISNEFDKHTKELITRAISLGRGLVFNKLTPLTTHIICNSNKENFNNRSFGQFFKPVIINPNWVIDSLEKKNLLLPENYLPISFQAFVNETSSSKRNEIVISSTIISNIFKNQTFYICADSYPMIEQIYQIKEKIIQNSGELLEPDVMEEKNNIKAQYLIINDGYSQNELANLIERKINNYQFIMSHRFIDMCIEKRELIDVAHCKYIHLLPFHFPVPFEDFKQKQISAFFYKFPLTESNKMEYLLETIGGTYDLSPNTTHIIFKDTIEKEKIKYFREKYSQNILFVSIEWLLECLIEGKVADEEKYLAEDSVVLSNP